MRRKRLLAIIMALSITVGILPTYTVKAAQNTTDTTSAEQTDIGEEVEAVEDTIERIEIRTASDLIEFASQCYLDSWSRNKYVILLNDIDLTDTDFEPVPVFSGTFDGDGHTISGFDYVGDGYVVGLFRYIENDGMVKALTLKGNISSANEEECIGSIAGINRGSIRNCTFIGTVSGRDTVGGIVGTNEATGTISGCISKGRVTAYYSTGGIAGINHGAINYCTNIAGINDNEAWVETDDEMGGVEMVKNLVSDEDISEVYSGVDTGGIAGYSDGYITRCNNKGTVGYEHTGYNIGGIVGRQAGVVSLSTNNGTVYGRKDIGGIAGQTEPDIEVNEAESLRDALDTLHDLINKTIDDMSSTKNVVKKDLDNMLSYIDSVVDTGDVLVTQLTDFADDNIGGVNSLTERTETVLDMLPDVMNSVDTAINYANQLSERINQLVQDIDFVDDISGSDRSKLEEYQKDVVNNSNDLSEYIVELQDPMERLNASMTKDTGERKDRDDYITDPEYTKALSDVEDIIAEMIIPAGKILVDVIGITKILTPYIESAAKAASNDANLASESAENTLNALKSANNYLKSIINYLNSQDDLKFSQLGEEFDTTKESFHDELIGLSDSIKTLNNNASSYTDVVNNDLKAVNNQLNLVFNILADRVIQVDELGLDDFYEDVSDVDIDAITKGRVEYCENNGVVQGDINIGGIAGAMAIDDEDLEGSAAGNTDYTLGRSYTAKSLIIGSVNNGYITSKKDGAGGICGYMDQGIIVDSEGYGRVESTEGDYVGGICGQSMTIIRDCYALCSVSGEENVGGIAGYADTLTGCYAMASVLATNGRAGAIAGQVASYEDMGDSEDDEPSISNNYFVNDELNGIDNISYVGVAEPITYPELLTVENIPTDFWHLQVIYWIEDTYLGSEEVKYGDTLDNITFPDIPEKEGYYGEWPDVSGKVVNGTIVIEAEYKDDVTVVKSIGTENNLALIEDRFTQDTVLVANKLDSETSIVAPIEAEGNDYVIYDLSLEDDRLTDIDTFSVRLLNPYDNEATVYVYTDKGDWQALESKVRGQYLQVTMTGTQQYFCIVDKPSNLCIIIAFAVATVAVLAILLIIVIIVKLIKKGKARRISKKSREI